MARRQGGTRLQQRETVKLLCEYGKCTKWATINDGTPLCTQHALLAQKQPKWKNQRTTVDAIKFDSKREAREWIKLTALFRRGKIRNLTRQCTYELRVSGVHVCNYRSDFEWDETTEHSDGPFDQHVVADAKGARTREYIIKRNLMKAVHGISIREL